VGIVTRLRAVNRGLVVRFLEGIRGFSQAGYRVHTVSCSIGILGVFPGFNPLGREADDAPPNRVGVKESVELCLHSSTRIIV